MQYLRSLNHLSVGSWNLGKMSKLSRNNTSAATNTSNSIRLGVCQIKVGMDKQKNLETARNAIIHCKNKGADVVVLPEVFNSPYSNDHFRNYSEELPSEKNEYLHSNIIKNENMIKNSPSVHMLSEMSNKHGLYIIGGSVPELDKKTDKVFNTSLVFNNKGDIIGKHRKMHLFDIDIPNKIRFMESETLSPGEDFTTFDIELNDNKITCGLAICFDIRFMELFSIYKQKGCKLMFIPGAFNTTTGPLHWELLIRARALDNQAYIVACSPARNPDLPEYPVYGYSTIADPWGKVIDKCDEKENIIICDIDLDQVENVKQSIPIWTQKRYDLYQPAVSKL